MFGKIGQIKVIINTRLPINRITIPKIAILKKFSENVLSRKLDKIPRIKDKISIKK